MADEKTGTNGIEAEANNEIADKELEDVAGGAGYTLVCPNCGSYDVEWRGEARAHICMQCGCML